MNQADEFDAELRRGAALFNAGRYFEAHEAWELIWRGAADADRTIVQGLIQAAAAMLHRERGNPRGAARLWKKARAKLESAPESYRGLTIGELRLALERCFIGSDRPGAADEPRPAPRPRV